jgi:hypothetical protein
MQSIMNIKTLKQEKTFNGIEQDFSRDTDVPPVTYVSRARTHIWVGVVKNAYHSR